jgi:type II secretory ATPase GspE/PulE/Tfp pilus assembly ATPase PilB-like protein
LQVSKPKGSHSREFTKINGGMIKMGTEVLSLINKDVNIIKLVDNLISDAIEHGASDIHIEPHEDRLIVRFRIDGDLQEIDSFPIRLHSSIVSRIKIISNLNITEHRLPQDGCARIEDVDLRINVISTIYGEKIVIRILDPNRLCLDLAKLGFEQDSLKLYQQTITTPHGIILITGPTGSGKSTTLYSTLSTINSPNKNIITIEEPVEYRLKGINQIEVKNGIGLDFKTILSSILRQDPDIILIGEIRDKQTAEVAINAALTGHLVFATLHTNDAPSTIMRLINLGIERFLIAEALKCIVSQRLVKKVCTKCKTQVEPTKEILKIIKESIQVEEPDKINLIKGTGCQNCFQTGYKDRTGIYEIMPISDVIKNAIFKMIDFNKLRKIAKKQGLRTLREDGMYKVIRGVTTIEEVLRVTNSQF